MPKRNLELLAPKKLQSHAPGPLSGSTDWSGAGKSTVATMVCEEFGRRGYRTEFLDADAIRKSLSHELEFSRSDCEENSRRDRIRGGTFVAASNDCSCGGDYPLPVDARRTERSKRELL